MYISCRALKGKKYLFRDIHNFSFSAKTEIFSLGTEYCCTTLWVKNSLEIALSLTISKIFSMIYFPLKSKMAAKSSKLFPLCIGHSCTTLQVKKFTSNHSILYGFRDIHTFSFSAKIQDGHQKWRKLKFFPFA